MEKAENHTDDALTYSGKLLFPVKVQQLLKQGRNKGQGLND
jgi:hypothetical protein